jgi:hypothetical protein
MELYLMNESKGLTVLENFVNTLEQFGIAYAIGGSMASSIYGNVRFTQDADITVEPFDNLAEKLIDSLKNEYYVSEQAVHQALRQKGSFNAIHIESAFKIDIFIQKDTAFEKQLVARRKLLKLSDMLDKSFSVVSPEDIILLKLCWHRDSGYESEHQWNDVLGVLEIQGDRIDFEYLRKWAVILGINELLEKALSETKES